MSVSVHTVFIHPGVTDWGGLREQLVGVWQPCWGDCRMQRSDGVHVAGSWSTTQLPMSTLHQGLSVLRHETEPLCPSIPHNHVPLDLVSCPTALFTFRPKILLVALHRAYIPQAYAEALLQRDVMDWSSGTWARQERDSGSFTNSQMGFRHQAHFRSFPSPATTIHRPVQATAVQADSGRLGEVT